MNAGPPLTETQIIILTTLIAYYREHHDTPSYKELLTLLPAIKHSQIQTALHRFKRDGWIRTKVSGHGYVLMRTK